MANKSYQIETREAAFRKWRECGQNFQLAQKELKKDGYIISQPTLYDWAEKYNWKDRAARADTEEQKTKDINASFEKRLLADMMEQKDNYNQYLKGFEGGKIDVNAYNGYVNLCKAIIEIRDRTGAFKAGLFIDFMKDLIDWLSRNDPETVNAIEKNFDEFVAWAKEKYK